MEPISAGAPELAAHSSLSIFRRRHEHVLFMHWPIPVELLRSRVPKGLELELFDGSAWIGMLLSVARTMRPMLPGLTHELGVRTYVKGGGIYIFTVELDQALSLWTSHRVFHFPGHRARMVQLHRGSTFAFSSHRIDDTAPPAELTATWSAGTPLARPEPSSLEHFILERTVAHTDAHDIRIAIDPVALHDVHLGTCYSTIFESLGLHAPKEPPVVHYTSEQTMEIWPPRRR